MDNSIVTLRNDQNGTTIKMYISTFNKHNKSILDIFCDTGWHYTSIEPLEQTSQIINEREK